MARCRNRGVMAANSRAQAGDHIFEGRLDKYNVWTRMNTSKSISLRRTANQRRVESPSPGLRPVLARFSPWRMAAYAIVVLIVSISVTSMLAKTAPQREARNPIHLGKAGKKWVKATLRSLSLEEKIGQMLMGRCFLDYASFDSPDYKQLRDDLQKYHMGSLVVAAHVDRQGLVRPSPLEAAKVANQLQADSKLPLLIAADLERGLASRVAQTLTFNVCGAGADACFIVSA